MPSIHFTFGADVADDERQRVLDEIRSWNGIATASQLKPESRHPVTARLAYATVSEDANVAELADRIGALGCVDSADVPARRGIATEE